MLKVKYASLCHWPSLISKDCITIAVLFYIQELKEIRLEKIKNWKRVSSFNDELDIELLKIQLEDMVLELEEFIHDKNFKIEEYTKFYVNNIKFDSINEVEIELDNKDNFINECKSQYLYCDLNENKRPTIDEQINFIKKYLNDKSLSINGKVDGHFNENINFDFRVNEFLFKKFTFKEKNPNRLIKTVKEWAYDAYKLKEKYKIVFITDINELEENDQYKILLRILKEESDFIFHSDEAFKFILELLKTSNLNNNLINENLNF